MCTPGWFVYFIYFIFVRPLFTKPPQPLKRLVRSLLRISTRHHRQLHRVSFATWPSNRYQHRLAMPVKLKPKWKNSSCETNWSGNGYPTPKVTASSVVLLGLHRSALHTWPNKPVLYELWQLSSWLAWNWVNEWRPNACQPITQSVLHGSSLMTSFKVTKNSLELRTGSPKLKWRRTLETYFIIHVIFVLIRRNTIS